MKTTFAFVAVFLVTTQGFTWLSPCLLPRLAPLYAYVPSGLSDAEYKRIKQADKKKMGENLGSIGPRGFKSRSLQSWQEAHELNQAQHIMSPVGYKKTLKEGKMKKQDVPYMVRGGSWDNSDVPGAKRMPWLKSDKKYASGGYKKEQSASILGGGPGLDWTSSRPRNENLEKQIPGMS